jgi:hypothetical protein
MKKLFCAAVAILTFGLANAQDLRFGVKAGLLTSAYDGYALHKDDNGLYGYYAYPYTGRLSSTESSVGFYAGGLVEFDFLKDFKLQPELTLTYIPSSSGYLAVNVPVLLKYSFFEKFYAQAGPALNFAIDGDGEQFSPSLDLGASYDLMDNFYVELRGDIGLSGYLGTSVNAGVGYRL